MKKVIAFLLALGMVLSICACMAEEIWYTDGTVLYRGKHETVATLPDFGDSTLCTLYLQRMTGEKVPEPFVRYDYGDGISMTLLKDGSAIVQDVIGGLLYGMYYGTWSLNETMRVEVQLDDTVFQMDSTQDDGIFAAMDTCTLYFDWIPRVTVDPLTTLKETVSLEDFEGTWNTVHMHACGMDIELTDTDTLKRLGFFIDPGEFLQMIVRDGKVHFAGEDIGALKMDENGTVRIWDPGSKSWVRLDLTENGDICMQEEGTEEYIILRKTEE